MCRALWLIKISVGIAFALIFILMVPLTTVTYVDPGTFDNPKAPPHMILGTDNITPTYLFQVTSAAWHGGLEDKPKEFNFNRNRIPEHAW